MIELLNAVRDTELRSLIKLANKHERLREKHERLSEDGMIAAGLILIEAYANAKGQHGVWKKFCEERDLIQQTAHDWMIKAGYKPTEKAPRSKTAKLPAGNSTSARNTRTNATKTGTPIDLPTEPIPTHLRTHKIIGEGQGLLGKLQKIQKEILEFDEVDEEPSYTTINAMLSTFLSVAEAARKIANALRHRYPDEERTHLMLVDKEDVA